MKQYIKPEITEIRIAANQAIAACAITNPNISALGYAYEGQACSEASTFYPSKQAVVDANIYQAWGMKEEEIKAKSFMNYRIDKPDGSLAFLWEDKNGNNQFDDGDNWQDVRDWDYANKVFIS